METFELPCTNEEKCVSLALFVEVKNAASLRRDLTSGKLQAAILDTTLLVSSFHVLSAVNKAVMNSEQGRMRTKNVYSEIIYSLSPSTNISDAFKRFGIQDSSKSVVLVVVHCARDTEQVSDIVSQVEGEQVAIEQLAVLQDKEAITKFYQIDPDESAISSLENSVVTRMTVRDVT